MWPPLAVGCEEVPYSVHCGPGCSWLPGQPQGPARLSHHTPRVCPKVPSRTHWGLPQVLPGHGCQDQLRVPLFLPLVWAFPVFFQKKRLPQLSNSVKFSGEHPLNCPSYPGTDRACLLGLDP